MDNTQRTIVEVLDLETGEIIDANSFFNQEEGIIFNYRRQQQEAAEGFGEAKFKCIYCDQLIRINGKGSGAGKKSFYFSHLSNSEYCDIKLVDGLTEEEKQERRYTIRRESKRHKELKHFVYEMLLKNMEYTEGVTEAALEQTYFHASLDLFKRPDIFATYNGISIAFEVQLSTIFLDIIIGRDKFYAEHGVFIIWIFNLLNEEQEWQRVMEKDIYYANKRNAFVLTNKAMEISKERNKLFFYCYWQKPIIKGDKIKVTWYRKLISLADLKYDYVNHKVYYHDSNADFEKAQQDLLGLINAENATLMTLYKSGKMPHIEFQEGRRVGWKYKERILIPCEYSELEYLGNGFVKGQKRRLKNEYGDDKWSLLHVVNGVITPCYFDIIKKLKNGFSALKNLKWGRIDEQGTTSIPFEFDEIGEFSNGKAVTKKDGKWGRIDEQGINVIPFEFDIIGEFSQNNATAKKDGKWGSIDEYGINVIPFEFDEIGKFSNGKAVAKKDGKWGCINEHGTILILFEFDGIKSFANDFFYLSKRVFRSSFTEVLENGKIYVLQNDKIGCISEEGNILIPCEFDEIRGLSNGKVKVKKDGKWGYYSTQGNILILCEFDEINELSNDKVKVKKDGKWGYYGTQGNILIPCEFDEINELSNDKVKVKKDDKWGYVDEQGTTLIPFEFDKIGEFSNGKAVAIKDGKWGRIDEQGTTLIPFVYDKIREFSNGKAFAQKDGKWGRIDEQGTTLISFEYNDIRYFQNGLAVAQKKGKWGCIDETGKEAITFIHKKEELFKHMEQAKRGTRREIMAALIEKSKRNAAQNPPNE